MSIVFPCQRKMHKEVIIQDYKAPMAYGLPPARIMEFTCPVSMDHQKLVYSDVGDFIEYYLGQYCMSCCKWDKRSEE